MYRCVRNSGSSNVSSFSEKNKNKNEKKKNIPYSFQIKSNQARSGDCIC